MRILVAHRGYGAVAAGAEQMATRTAAALAVRGHEVCLLIQSNRERLGPAPDGVACTFAAEADGLAEAGAEWEPEVVHLVDAVDASFGEVAARLARDCGSLLGVTPASTPSFWEDRNAGVELCNSADVLFCLTRAELEVLRSIGVAAADPWFLPQAPALGGVGDRTRFQARHGLGSQLVLFLGRKIRSKGYQELLAASAEVWRELPDVSFVFAGSAWDGDCATVFERHRDRRILDLGRVSDEEKEDALAACDVLCLPTSEDVSPLVFAEAWSYGKPVISGVFPGVEEIVHHDRDGLVVLPCPAEIAAAITTLLRDPQKCHQLGAHGRARAAEEMSWDAVAARVEAAYGNLLPLGRRPQSEPDRGLA